jgi:site-specific recombinase XerD
MKNVTEFIPSVTSNTRPPKLLDQLRRCIRDKHYSLRTEDAYVYWARWFIRFHGLRHPAEMGTAEVQAFLSYLANDRKVAASTHKQALCALLFLYKQVLQMELPWMEQLRWPNRPPRRPTVLTPAEVDALLGAMSAPMRFRPSLVRDRHAADGVGVHDPACQGPGFRAA